MGIRSDLDANFDFEVVDEFLDHYSMMVESMEIMILDLSNEEMYRRSVDELFRVFHNKQVLPFQFHLYQCMWQKNIHI